MFVTAVSNEFKEAVKAPSRVLKALVYINKVEYTGDEIVSMTLDDGINSGDIFTVGEVFAKSVDLELLGDYSIPEGSIVEPFLGLKVDSEDGEYEYFPLGVFFVNEVSSNKSLLKLRCYDNMYGLENEYVASIPFPASLVDLLSDVCKQNELDYTGELLDINILREPKGYSTRELISFLASLLGCNARFNRLGTLEFVGFTETNNIITGESYVTFNKGDDYRVSAITCKFGDVGNTRGDDTYNCVSFVNPLVDDSNIDSIYNKLNGIKFTSGQLKYRGDFSLDAGDFVTVIDTSGEKYKVLISQHQITFRGGVSGNIKSIGEGKENNSFVQNKFRNKKSLTELNIKLGEVQTIVQEVETNYDDLTERVKTAEQKITAEAITSTVTSSETFKEVVGNHEALAERVNQAEQKITAEAITTTVTSSQTFKEKVGREIFVRGTGLGNSAPVEVWVDGENVYSNSTRGLHLIALNKDTLKLEHSGYYDIGFNSDSSEDFLADIRNYNYNKDCIILLASYDSITDADGHNIYHQIPREINNIGGLFPDNGKQGYRQAFALIGYSKAGTGAGIQKFYPYTSNGEVAEVIAKVSDGRLVNTDNTHSQVYETMAEIKVQADEIYMKVEDTDGKVSQLTQDLDGFEFKVANSGGANLTRNGQFLNGTASYWGHEYAFDGTGKSINIIGPGSEWCLDGRNCLQIQGTNSTQGQYGMAQNVILKKNTTYTLSGYSASHRANHYIYIQRNGGDWWVPCGHWNTAHGGKDDASWDKWSMTFTTDGSGSDYKVHLAIRDCRNDGFAWFTDITLVEGGIKQKYSPHAEEVYNSSTLIDGTGMTVNNGAIRIKNKAGSTVLEGDSNGNLTMSGTMRSEGSGGRAIAVNSGGLSFQDSFNSEKILRAATTFFESERGLNGVTFAIPSKGDFIRYAWINQDDLDNGFSGSVENYSFMDIWVADQKPSSFQYYKGVNIYSPVYMSGKMCFRTSTAYTNDIASVGYAGTEGILAVCGDNGLFLGYKSGADYMSRLTFSESTYSGTGDHAKSWATWNFNGYTLHNATFSGRFVNSYANTATKRYVQSNLAEVEYSQVRVNFEDVQLNNGKAILNIPNEYVGLIDGYVISSIVKKGKGEVWVSSEEEKRFFLESTYDILVNVEIILKLNTLAIAKNISEEIEPPTKAVNVDSIIPDWE